MSKLEQHSLSGDLVDATQALQEIQEHQGAESPAYRDGLIRVARLWSVLKMTRSRDEFLREVSNS